MSLILGLYRGVSSALGPIAPLVLDARARAGKEDGARRAERFGHARTPRPAGPLMWLHGASVGESGVARLLIEALAPRRPDLSFLVTTGTRTSAELLARRLPPRTQHTYAPIDLPQATARFIDHWRPDLGVFIESDLWPNLIFAAEAAGTPLALVNARMSVKTLARWRRWPATGRRLMRAFTLALAADTRTAEALSALRGEAVTAGGNLKLGAGAPHVDGAAAAALGAEIGARKVWLAASTHEGEDEVLLAAHAMLRGDHADALLLLAPRHPERGADVASLADDAPRRSRGDAIGAAPVYVLDTMGDLGMCYAAAPASFIAGSLCKPLTGHNPVEAVLMDSLVIAGPYVESFSDLYGELDAAGGVVRAGDACAVAAAVRTAWDEPARAAEIKQAARVVVARGAAALETAVARLAALLPAPAPVAADATA